MSFDQYFKLGGAEIVNGARVTAYAKNAKIPALLDARLLDEVNTLESLLAGTYTDPVTDNAPWYDPADPTTADFLGVYSLGTTGIGDSTSTAAVTQSINDGGSVGDSRSATRDIKLSLQIFGNNDLGVERGLTWLRDIVESANISDTLSFYLDKPDPANPTLTHRRYFKVSYTSGPSVISRYSSSSECYSMMQIEMILTATIPQPFQDTYPIPLTFGAASSWNDPITTLLNLFSNPSFESSIAGWTGGGLARVAIPAALAANHNSAWAASITSGTTITYQSTTQVLNLDSVYSAGVWVYNSGSVARTGSLKVTRGSNSGAGTGISTSGPTVSLPAGQWTLLSNEGFGDTGGFTVNPASYVTVQVVIDENGTEQNST